MNRGVFVKRAFLALSCVVTASILAACSSTADPSSEGDPSASSPETTSFNGTLTAERHHGYRDLYRPTPTPSAPAAPTAPSAPPPQPFFHGVNLSGADFGNDVPGTINYDYSWPTPAEIDYYMGKGLETYRISFLWERMQPSTYAALDPTYLAALESITSYATSKGGYVLLNPQNFARYWNELIGSSDVPNAAFADFWSKLSSAFASNPHVMFGLVNEPNTMPTEQWVSAANAAIAAIRQTGATNTITVPGNDWTSAEGWYGSWYGTPNATALLAITDPAQNVLFEAHQYLFADTSTTYDDCVSTTIGTERLAPFIQWLRDNGKKGIIGEFAGGRNATCYAAIQDMLQTMTSAKDVLQGWLWWGGGPRWPSDYIFAMDPLAGVDRPYMPILAPFLP